MSNNFDWTIQNNIAFERKLDGWVGAIKDFRIPFRLIASDFYRSQKQLFQLQSEGLYKPLGGKDYNSASGFGTQTKRERAEDQKERRTGHAWAPILFGKTGDLKDSTLKRNHKNSIFYLGKAELHIGSSVPYGPYHQSGTAIMEQRQFVFITGGPGDKSKDSGIYGRRERWLSILNTHIEQLVTGKI